MDAYTFAEWEAFDQLEPLDPAGVILRGLSSGGNGAASESSKSVGWQDAYAKMHKIAKAATETILVPPGKTPEQVWKERRDDW